MTELVRVGLSFFGQCQTQSIPKNCKYLWPFGLLGQNWGKIGKKTVYFCVVAVLNIGWWSLEITRVSLSHKAEDNLFWNSVRTYFNNFLEKYKENSDFYNKIFCLQVKYQVQLCIKMYVISTSYQRHIDCVCNFFHKILFGVGGFRCI